MKTTLEEIRQAQVDMEVARIEWERAVANCQGYADSQNKRLGVYPTDVEFDLSTSEEANLIADAQKAELMWKAAMEKHAYLLQKYNRGE